MGKSLKSLGNLLDVAMHKAAHSAQETWHAGQAQARKTASRGRRASRGLHLSLFDTGSARSGLDRQAAGADKGVDNVVSVDGPRSSSHVV
eukprot:368948-Prymnesium_polylepis.2